MPLQKETIEVNFAQGLDLKSDKKQIKPGKFLRMVNRLFNKGGLLEKRNGYKKLPSVPEDTSFLTKFKGNLTAVGDSFWAYSSGSKTWVNKGRFKNITLNTLPLIRNSINQSQADSVVSSNGLVCTAYTEDVPDGSGGTTPSYKYVIADSETGQNIVAPTEIPVTTGTISGAPRVFLLGRYFIIVFTNTISGTDHLQYVAIQTNNPTNISEEEDVSDQYVPASTLAFDGVVANDNLYIAWNASDVGGAIRATYFDSTLQQHNEEVYAGYTADYFSVCADTSSGTPTIWVTFYESSSGDGYAMALSQNLVEVLSATAIVSGDTDFLNFSSSAADGVLTIYGEHDDSYSYDSTIHTHTIQKALMTVGGSLTSFTDLVLSLGLASKAFIIDGVSYVMGAYESDFQSGYYMIDEDGHLVARLAYQNGGGYLTAGVPNVSVLDSSISVPYLVKDLLKSVNKDQGVSNSVNGLYSQTGINLVTYDFDPQSLQYAELGNNLNIAGGFLWAYDGYLPNEQGFFVYPEDIDVTTSGSGGLIGASDYYYSVTYEWSDNQGNLFKSAPSIPVKITTTGTTSSNTISIPTLRLTYKIDNPVKIVIYRWSTAQPIYYEVTSVLSPLLNDPTVNDVSFVDTLSDASILGNTILYTTGGVLENISAPCPAVLGLFKNRLWLLNAEDRNTCWYSKIVIEGVPVEMSDLLTYYVAPTVGAQGDTGEVEVLGAMDDKIIFFKKDAAYYATGSGPDNTGANNDLSDPIYITSTVGSPNPDSLVLTTRGLMFQSDKGIWILERGLGTDFIGAPVDDFNDVRVTSAFAIPETNQVRFTLENRTTILYDYYYDQWAEFESNEAIDAVLYEGLHTYITPFGEIFQETPGIYLDGSRPVLTSFTTGWMNFAGVQGFERAYWFSLIGDFLSPHKLHVQIAYDYNPSPSQSVLITPLNSSSTYGSESIYGGGEVYGGSGSLEQFQIFFDQQKCQAFQITVTEVFDSSSGQSPGAGFNLSSLKVVVGLKARYPKLNANQQVG